MSKIQDALKRLQSEGSVNKPAAGHPAATLAKVSSTGIYKAAGLDHNNGLIVELDQKALRDAGLIAPDYHEQMLADQYRNIKRPLLANAYSSRVTRVADGNIMMITSAIPSEGKTFTAMNLAISIAQEQDYSTLLIDADVAKPHVSNVFGLGDVPGLLDLLEGTEDHPEALFVKTDLPGLSILPAGKKRHNATELLSGRRMEGLIKRLATEFPQQVSIFDTPPLLHTSESRVITNWAGQVVLVVKAESTSQGAVEEALQVLGDDAVINLVLNQSRFTGSDSHYSYGYGYGSSFESN